MSDFTQNNKDLTSQFANKNVLVIGGSGFIGSALVNRLCTLDANLFSLGLPISEKNTLSDNGVHHIFADLRNAEDLATKLSKHSFQYVFNLGGFVNHSPFLKEGRSVIDAHFVGTLNLLESIYTDELLRYVHIGSSDEYGSAKAPQSENMREAPISPYSVAKTAATHLVESLARSEGLPGVVARFFLVYGPEQGTERFIPFLIKNCLEGKQFPTSKGEQLRDFCFIDDIVDGLLLCAIKEEAIGKTFNLASGEPISIRQMINSLVEIIGSGEPDFGAYPYRPGENMELYADITKAKEILDWKPQIPLNEGLQRTLAWFKEQQ